jgi:hypothetical protein
VNKPRHGGPRISTQHTTGPSRPDPRHAQRAHGGTEPSGPERP